MKFLRKHNKQDEPTKKERAWLKKRSAVVAVTFVVALALLSAGAYVWSRTYDDRIAPRTSIGTVSVSGLTFDEARSRLNEHVDAILIQGVDVRVGGVTKNIAFSSVGAPDSDASQDYVTFDVDAALAEAMATGRDDQPALQVFSLILCLVNPTDIALGFQIDEQRFSDAVRNAFPDAETLAKDAELILTTSPDGGSTVDATASASGTEFVWGTFFETLTKRIRTLERSPIDLALETREPDVLRQDILAHADEIAAILDRAPYTLSYDPMRFDHREWSYGQEALTADLRVELVDGTVQVTLDPANAVFQAIADQIETPAVDARLTVENARVTEFVPSQDGISLDRGATIDALRAGWSSPETEQTSFALVVTSTKPNVNVSDVNDLGITEVLGVGTSDYSNSPWNRIQNIKNGVNLLNGILIPPGEEFSLLGALKPFTYDNGYLSELVIKGDKIEPEVGGGLCQIGTTTFRATMNSGLPITMRRNHSLVVSHYNDPTNGNPGTDATIYDPAPDFRFINDTGHYILFETEMDTETETLRFTFWGTSDGRKGYYTAPVVLRWIGVGEPKTTETEDLEPGVTKCQNAFPGADTSFTYIVEQPDGTKSETVYESHYRALPKICLVGVDPNAPKEEETPADGTTDGVPAETTSDATTQDGAEVPLTEG